LDPRVKAQTAELIRAALRAAVDVEVRPRVETRADLRKAGTLA